MLLFGILALQSMPPAQQFVVGRHQRSVMCDCGCRNDAIRRIAMKAFEFGRKNCYFTGLAARENSMRVD
jgi:hypothetical protein